MFPDESMDHPTLVGFGIFGRWFHAMSRVTKRVLTLIGIQDHENAPDDIMGYCCLLLPLLLFVLMMVWVTRFLLAVCAIIFFTCYAPVLAIFYIWPYPAQSMIHEQFRGRSMDDVHDFIEDNLPQCHVMCRGTYWNWSAQYPNDQYRCCSIRVPDPMIRTHASSDTIPEYILDPSSQVQQFGALGYVQNGPITFRTLHILSSEGVGGTCPPADVDWNATVTIDQNWRNIPTIVGSMGRQRFTCIPDRSMDRVYLQNGTPFNLWQTRNTIHEIQRILAPDGRVFCREVGILSEVFPHTLVALDQPRRSHLWSWVMPWVKNIKSA